jgi:hypothetical protein
MARRTYTYTSLLHDTYLACDSFRTHGPDAIACIWIRKVDGADNSAARFAAAFKGVPAERIRTYSDKDILDVLPKVDIKGGKC